MQFPLFTMETMRTTFYSRYIRKYHNVKLLKFCLQNQHTLSQAAEKIAQKPRAVQEKYFQLIEFLVHHIHYIPTKELIAISLLLKGKKNLECCVLAVQSLISILKFDNIFKDVFREVGKKIYICILDHREFSPLISLATSFPLSENICAISSSF